MLADHDFPDIFLRKSDHEEVVDDMLRKIIAGEFTGTKPGRGEWSSMYRCNQVAGVDYDQTFSAALRSPSLRLLAAYASQHEMKIRRWDFVSAYLQGELEDGEVAYCHAPPGYERPGYVCKVVKPVYGMVTE